MVEQHLGKYTLLERLGGGGMAEVFRARLRGPEGFEKQLALKLILSHYSEEPEFVRMFIQEATLAAHLDHANIVRIYEFDQIDGRYYIAMELISGKDLRKVMVQSNRIKRPVRIPEILVVAQEACRGLAFAHGEIASNSPKIVHRDISPHNIIISQAGEVKITDFGIAKLASSATVTKTGLVKGKAAYMAPEQARGGLVDHRCDIFSLGCVIWELLTNRRLFSGDNEYAIVESLMRDTIEPPIHYNPQVPDEVSDLVLSMLQRDPEKRSDSAFELAKKFDRLLYLYPGVDRYTLLVELYQQLFSNSPEHTAILPSDDKPITTRLADKSDEIYRLIENTESQAAQEFSVPKRRRGWLGVTLVVTILLVAFTFLGIYGLNLFDSRDEDPTSGSKESRQPTTKTTSVASQVSTDPKDASLRGGDTPSVVVTPTLGSKDDVSEQNALVAVGPSSGMEAGKVSIEPKEDEPSVLEKTPPASKPKADAGKNPKARSGKTRNTRRASPPQKKENGFLDLNAIPWARVYWRKKFLGPTPLQNFELPPGEHTLILENQDLGIREKVSIRINPKRKTKRLVNLLNN